MHKAWLKLAGCDLLLLPRGKRAATRAALSLSRCCCCCRRCLLSLLVLLLLACSATKDVDKQHSVVSTVARPRSSTAAGAGGKHGDTMCRCSRRQRRPLTHCCDELGRITDCLHHQRSTHTGALSRSCTLPQVAFCPHLLVRVQRRTSAPHPTKVFDSCCGASVVRARGTAGLSLARRWSCACGRPQVGGAKDQ